MLKRWEELPRFMQTEPVKEYYDILNQKRKSLAVKRGMDVLLSSILLIILLPIMLVIGIVIKCDSRGPVIFRQVRITQYGRKYRIYKFRTMVSDPDIRGTQITIKGDVRITKVGKRLRSLRLDELPQLVNVLLGDMSFVGTRPEVQKYVKSYTAEMYATLLLPAGITSEASIRYKDEERLLAESDHADEVYVKEILPEKMRYNLRSIKRFSIGSDILTMIRTVLAVFVS